MEKAEANLDPSAANTIKESREERRKHRSTERKKQGSLPLRMFLSMDGKTAHPECVHASNPFHKCADRCFHNNPAASRAKSWTAARGKSAGSEKRNGNMDVDPKCVHASNPFHVCADACFRRLAGQDDRVKSGGQRIIEKGPSDSDHRVVLGKVRKDGVHPMCPHASNPFHACVESCLQRISHKDGGAAAVRIAKQEKGEMAYDDHRTQCCKNASNPFHDEYCVKRKAGREAVKRGQTGSMFTPVNVST